MNRMSWRGLASLHHVNPVTKLMWLRSISRKRTMPPRYSSPKDYAGSSSSPMSIGTDCSAFKDHAVRYPERRWAEMILSSNGRRLLPATSGIGCMGGWRAGLQRPRLRQVSCRRRPSL